MSMAATARSVPGTLRQEISVGGHRLVTDQPKEHGGGGSAPSPHELLPAALAACVAWSLTTYGRTKGWDLGDVTVEVDYDNAATPRAIAVRAYLSGELDELQLARLEKAAASCPVRRSLEAGFQFVEELSVAPRERELVG